MKKILIYAILFFHFQAFAVGKLSFEPIGIGSSLKIAALIELPKGQKFNPKAPSKINVYEQEGKEWVLTEKVDLNGVFSLSDMINFRKPVKLKSEVSRIKIEASLYHCPKFGGGMCVIDDFEGVVERSNEKSTTELKLALKARPPAI